MKASTLFSFILFSASYSLLGSTITLRIHPYPDIEKNIERLKHPSTLARNHLDAISYHSLITGIFVTYAGFLEASNSDGYIIFPRKHIEAKVHLLITSQITPIVMFEQTIDHWEVVPNVPRKMYTFTQNNDPETNLTYWQVEDANVPENNIIPLETLIIITEPEYIHVPVGITLTNEGPNLILPTIYVHKEIPIIENSLYILKLAHLFRPAHVLHTKTETYHALQLHE